MLWPRRRSSGRPWPPSMATLAVARSSPRCSATGALRVVVECGPGQALFPETAVSNWDSTWPKSAHTKTWPARPSHQRTEACRRRRPDSQASLPPNDQECAPKPLPARARNRERAPPRRSPCLNPPHEALPLRPSRSRTSPCHLLLPASRRSGCLRHPFAARVIGSAFPPAQLVKNAFQQDASDAATVPRGPLPSASRPDPTRSAWLVAPADETGLVGGKRHQ